MVDIYFYQEHDRKVPVFEWLQELYRTNRKTFAKCIAHIKRLAALGHELRRPESDYLRDGIYELRIKQSHVNYRILYFFQGRSVVILAHAITKMGQVPRIDIERALRCKAKFEENPEIHSFEGGEYNNG